MPRKVSLPWFRVDSDVARHPKLTRLMLLGKWSRPEALGMLVMFWAWVAEFAADGNLTPELLDALRFQMGDEDVDGLDPFVQAGFVDLQGDGGVVHDWYDANGSHIRRIHYDLTRNSRGTPAELTPDSHDPQGVDVDVDVDVESKKKNPPTPRRPRSARPEGEPEDFAAFYQSYPRRDGRRAAAKAFAQALARLPTYQGSDLVVAAKEFAQRCQRSGAEQRFIPLPATWLNQDRFREFFDEEETHDREPEDRDPEGSPDPPEAEPSG